MSNKIKRWKSAPWLYFIILGLLFLPTLNQWYGTDSQQWAKITGKFTAEVVIWAIPVVVLWLVFLGVRKTWCFFASKP